MSKPVNSSGPRYRAERVTAHHLKDVKLELLFAENWVAFPIINISKSGIGAYCYQSDEKPQVGEIRKSRFQFGEDSLEFQLEIKHGTPALFGAQYFLPEAEFLANLEERFAAEVLGARMRRLVSEEAEEFRFTDGFHNHFHYTYSGDEIKSFQLSFWGTIVDYKEQKLRTGRFLDFESEAASEPLLMSFDSEPDLATLQFAKQLLTQIEDFEQKAKSQIEEIIS